MNGPHTRAYVKDNAFTRLIDRVNQMNAEAGMPAGIAASQAAEHFERAIPAAKLARMTPAQQRAVEFIPPPLDPRAEAYASARAQAMGLAGDEDEPLPPSMPGPTIDEVEEMLPVRAPRQPAPAISMVPQGAPSQGGSRMPDFKKVEGFDLIRGMAVIDGMAFPIPAEDIPDMKRYAIQVVLDNVTYQLAQALISLGVPPELASAAATAAQAAQKTAQTEVQNGGAPATQAVLPVPAVENAGPVLEGQVKEGRMQQQVQEVRSSVDEDLQYLLPNEGGEGTDTFEDTGAQEVHQELPQDPRGDSSALEELSQLVNEGVDPVGEDPS